MVKDKKLWMGILRCRHLQSLFEFLSKKLSDEDFANARKTWKGYFDFIEKNDYSCDYLIQNVKRIQKLHVDLQDLSQGCKVFEVEFKMAPRKKLDRKVKKKRKPQSPKNYEKLKELKSQRRKVSLRVIITLHC